MEGVIFYWMAWIFWVIATFFMNRKGTARLKFSLWLLLLIIVSPHAVSIFNMEISIAGIFLVFSLFYYAARIERLKMLYLFICSFIMMLAYVSFHLFELFDPIWLIFPRNWMLAVLLVVISFLLQKDKFNRIFIVLLGSIQGEFLYALILSEYSFPYLVASFTFLDVAALSTVMLTLWNGIETLALFYEKYFNQPEREKRKLS